MLQTQLSSVAADVVAMRPQGSPAFNSSTSADSARECQSLSMCQQLSLELTAVFTLPAESLLSQATQPVHDSDVGHSGA